MSWFSQLWGDITGKNTREEAKRARNQGINALDINTKLAQNQLNQMPQYDPLNQNFDNYKLPEAVQKRMNIMKGNAAEVIDDQVGRALGTLSRKGMDTSGVGMALASKIRQSGGKALNQNLADVENQELNTARNFFLQDAARNESANYKQYLSNAERLKLLADLYKNKGMTAAQMSAQPLPAQQSDLGAALNIAGNVIPYI